MPVAAPIFTLRPDVPGETSNLNAIQPIEVSADLEWIDEVGSDDTTPSSSILPPITEPSVIERMLPPKGVSPAEVHELDDLLFMQQIQEHAGEAVSYRTGGKDRMSPDSIRSVKEITAEIKSRFDEGNIATLFRLCLDENDAINILKYFKGVPVVVDGKDGLLTPEQVAEKVKLNEFEDLPPFYALLLKTLKKNREQYERNVEEKRALRRLEKRKK